MSTYRHGEDESTADLVGTPYALAWERAGNDAWTVSQEFRLNNQPQDNTTLDWQLGLYYLKEDHKRSGNTLVLQGLCDFYPEECVDPPPFLGFLPLPDMNSAVTTQLLTQENQTDSFGMFGEVSYDLTERTNLLIGARYSYDKKEYFGIVDAVGALSFLFLDGQKVVSDIEDSWDDVSGKVALSHQFSSEIMGYASVATGYKGGAFNAEPASPDAVNAVDPEYVTTYEAGLKMDLLEDSLRLNMTVFYSDYEDIQATFLTPTSVAIAENVGEAEIKGYEIEGIAWLTSSLSMQFAYANYNHEYTEFARSSNDTGRDVVGNPITSAPDWTATLSLNYIRDLDSGATITLRGDYRGTGEISTQFDTTDSASIRPSAHVFNGVVKYTSPDANWSLSAWGRNLTEEEEVVTISPLILLYKQRSRSYGPPRTYGITLEYNF